MTAEEFAKKYAGKKVRGTSTLDSLIKNRNSSWPNATIIGSVVGFGERYVYLEPSAEYLKTIPAPETTIKYKSLYGQKVSAVKLKPDLLVPIDGSSISSAPKSTKERNIPAFPHTCRDCKSPALILGFSIDCSNAKCKNKYVNKSAQDLFVPVEIRAKDVPKTTKPVKSKSSLFNALSKTIKNKTS